MMKLKKIKMESYIVNYLGKDSKNELSVLLEGFKSFKGI